MCGIVGKLYFTPKKRVAPELLTKMAGVIAHRGPNDEGVWVKGNVGLANRRLSIIDPSLAGHQPMVRQIANGKGQGVITFNGEIYNFIELRQKLERKGYRFESRTDTEVIIYLYQEYGTECLKYLRGMFAFAIWDSNAKHLFLARDRVGKKPLKYYVGPDFFIFASEVKALFKDPDVPRQPDFEAIGQYLSLSYVPSPQTGFVGIKKLPPAHYLIVKSSGEVTCERYWRLDYSEKWRLPEKEWTQKILAKLREAVRLRMIADVPLGAMLSGGIDSSTVVALMSEVSGRPVKTFSIGFGDAGYNELPRARIVAQTFKTDHHEFVVKPEALEILPQLVHAFEEPFADSSAIPTWYLAELTRSQVTVALTGDGGDENFAGYNRYLAYKVDRIYNRLPRLLRVYNRQCASRFAPSRSFWGLVRTFITTSTDSPDENYARRLFAFTDEEKRGFGVTEWKEKIFRDKSSELVYTSLREKKGLHWLDRLLALDIERQLPDDLLVKMDIASMSHSLEARSPLLDHEFMELTAKITPELKLKGLTKKYIFKRSLEGILPASILSKPKQGFELPIREWLRGSLREFATSNILGTSSLSRLIFQGEYLKRLLEEHAQGREDHARRLWTLLALEFWFREFID